MKNLFRIAVLLLVASSVESFALGFLSYGPKMGVNMTSLGQSTAAGVDITGASSGSSWTAGLGFDVGAGQLGVMADFLYQRRGFTARLPSESSNLELSANYFHLPVQARFNLGMLMVSGGLYYGMAMGDLTCASCSTVDPSYAVAGLSKTDTGAVLGAGFLLPIPALMVMLEARYYHGLKNIVADSTVNGSRKYRQFEILAGVLF